jgi:nucleotide-binding universal stress UspA family protein
MEERIIRERGYRMHEIKRILFPVDFSVNSCQVADHVIYFAQKFDAHIYLLHVLECLMPLQGFYIPHISVETLEEDLKKAAEKKMEEFVHKKMKGYKGITPQVIIGIPHVEILKMAKEKAVDLIIMGTHGWTGLEHVIFGSVAGKVVRKAPCPVLTVRVKPEES